MTFHKVLPEQRQTLTSSTPVGVYNLYDTVNCTKILYLYARTMLQTFTVWLLPDVWQYQNIEKFSATRIERKAMIRNRYNYPTPPIRDIKGKEAQKHEITGP